MLTKDSYDESGKDYFIKGLHKCCEHEDTIFKLNSQSEKVDRFIHEIEPLMAYVRAEIKRNERRAKMYDRIFEQVLGATILAALGFLGSWLITLIKLKFFSELK